MICTSLSQYDSQRHAIIEHQYEFLSRSSQPFERVRVAAQVTGDTSVLWMLDDRIANMLQGDATPSYQRAVAVEITRFSLRHRSSWTYNERAGK